MNRSQLRCELAARFLQSLLQGGAETEYMQQKLVTLALEYADELLSRLEQGG
jgi:hypothetical protein